MFMEWLNDEILDLDKLIEMIDLDSLIDVEEENYF